MRLLRRHRATSPSTPRTARPSALEQARLDVFERSGWGNRFEWFQPRNAAFWVFAVVVLGGIWSALRQVRAQPESFLPTITTDAVVLALYGALLWWLTHTMDRYSTLPASIAVYAFLWGGFGATFTMAQQANTAILDLYGKTLGQRWAGEWGAGLTAPFIEETAKGLGLVLLITMAPRIIRTAFDAFIVGAFLGLGFLVLEDVLYIAQTAGNGFGTDPFHAALLTLATRIATGFAGHIAYSAIFATGLFLLIGSPAQPRRVGRGVTYILIALALHGIWDDAIGFAGPYPLLAFPIQAVMIVVTLLIVISAFRYTVARERTDMAVVLAPEVADGILTRAEADAAAGDGRARRHYVRGGASRRERSNRRAALRAVHDLANALPHADDQTHLAMLRGEVRRIREGTGEAPDPAAATMH